MGVEEIGKIKAHIENVNHKHPEIRKAAVNALRGYVRFKLSQKQMSEEPNLRLDAVKALGNTGKLEEEEFNGLVEDLVNLVSYERDRNVKIAAGGALMKLEGKKMIHFLLQAVREDAELYKKIPNAEAREIMGGQGVIKLVLESLNDPKPDVRSSAASILGIVGGKDELPHLKSKAEDPSPAVIERVKRSINEILLDLKSK